MSLGPLSSALLLAAGLAAAGTGMVRSGHAERHQGALGAEGTAVAVAGGEEARGQADGLVVPADSVLGLQLETTVSSDPARLDAPVVARVTRDVMVDGRVAVPTGARVTGTASLGEAPGTQGRDEPRGSTGSGEARGSVRQGQKGGGRPAARLEVRFHTLELPGGERVEIVTEPVVRESAAAGTPVARLGGGAAAGAVVGALLGGGRGAAIGGVLGAAGAAASAPPGDVAIQLQPGTLLSVRTLEDFRLGAKR